MILCLTNLSYKNLLFNNFLSEVKKINSTNIEVAPSLLYKKPHLTQNINKIISLLEREKIKIRSFQSVFYNARKINIENKKDFDYLIFYFKKIINLADKLGVKNLSIGSCPSRRFHYNQSFQEHFNVLLFRNFSKIAYKKDIIISVEPVSQKYNNFFLININEALLFIKKVNKKNIKLVLDTGNCKSEKINYRNFFIKYKRYINHIQLSDSNLNNLNINSIKKELKFFYKNNFKKTLTIEYFSNNGKKKFILPKIIKNYI